MCFNVGMSQFEQLSFSPEPKDVSQQEDTQPTEQDQHVVLPNLGNERDEDEEILDPETNERRIREAGLTEGLITGERALGFLEEIGESTTGMGITQAENRVHQIAQAGLMPYIPRALLSNPSTRNLIESARPGDSTAMTVLEKAAALKELRERATRNSEPSPLPSAPPIPPRPRDYEDRKAS